MVTAVPQIASAHAETVAAAKAQGVSVTASDTIYTRLTDSPQWHWWWGGRNAPFRAGGDYLDVVSHTSTSRTLGPAIGVVVERLRRNGVAVGKVLMPVDETALFGKPPAAEYQRPDGTTIVSTWPPIARYGALMTGIPLEQAEYDPILSDDMFSALQGLSPLHKEARGLYSALPADGGTGTWMLFARQTPEGKREYLLVPRETAMAVTAR